MKHNIDVFLRFLAILMLIFLGITALLPKSTIKDDDIALPLWNDIDDTNKSEIITLYKKGIVSGGVNGEYGVDEPFTADEAAYAVVRIYEDKNETEHTFNHYHSEKGTLYIKKAKEYKLWDKDLPKSGEAMMREDMAVIIAPLTKGDDVLNTIKRVPDDANLTYKDEALTAYNCGIMLEKGVAISYAPNKTVTRVEAVKLLSMCIDKSKRVEVKTPNYKEMQIEIEKKMSGWQGDWSLYFEDIAMGEVISVNSHQVYSASLIKLFVAQTVYQKAAEGSLKLTSKLNDEVRKMLTYSDNEAWKYAARTLGNGSYSRGMIEMTNVAQASGFADTGQFYKGEHKNYNFTSVNDCGAYLKGLLNGTIVNREYSDKILSLLKQQQHRQKIPAGLPETVMTANKTGELDYVQGDAAIVYAPNGTYILCIIGDNLENGYGQIGKIRELSKLIYEYLN